LGSEVTILAGGDRQYVRAKRLIAHEAIDANRDIEDIIADLQDASAELDQLRDAVTAAMTSLAAELADEHAKALVDEAIALADAQQSFAATRAQAAQLLAGVLTQLNQAV